MAIAVVIGGTTKTSSVLLNHLSIDYGLGSDWTATFPVKDTVSTSSAYRPALDATVTITDGATTLFHGNVTRVEDKPIAPPHIGTLTVVTARSRSQVVDQIIVNETYAAGQTLEDVVTDLQTTYLAAYSITLDATMATGATLEAQTFTDVTMRSVLNHLSAITGWLWRITPSDELQFFSAGTKTASFSLTAANKQSHGPITWDKTREQYVNSVRLRYGTESQVSKTWTATGNGVTTAWTLDYDSARDANNFILSAGYVTDDGVFSPLSAYPSGGTTWMFEASTNQLHRSSALANTKVATFVYAAQFPQTITVEDAGEIASNGKWAAIFEAPDIFDKDAATELATGLLRRYLTVPKWVRLSTRQGFVMPGDQITLTFTDRTVSGSHIITQVRATTIAKGTVSYALTCLSGSELHESWTDRLKAAIGGGGANAAGGTITGSVVPNFSGSFDEEVIARSGDKPVVIGSVGPIGLPGIWMRDVYGPTATDSSWAIYCGGGGESRVLRFMDTLEGDTSMLDFIRTGSSAYDIRPHSSSITLTLGTDTSGRRWSEVKALTIRANPQYFERGRSTAVGEWITPSFSAGNFTASSGSWTVDSGDVTTFAYTLIGKTMIVLFEIDNTDVSATPTDLRITIPGGFTAAKRTRNWAQVSDAGGAFQAGLCAINAGSTIISIYKDSTGANNYTTTSGDDTSVHGQIAFEVQ